MELNIFLENGELFRLQTNEEVTLGKILETTLNSNNKIIYEINGIFFTINGKRNYFGDDDFPFHFTLKRVREEVGSLNTFFLEDKNIINNLTETLRDRYLIYLMNQNTFNYYNNTSMNENHNGINIFSEIIQLPLNNTNRNNNNDTDEELENINEELNDTDNEDDTVLNSLNIQTDYNQNSINNIFTLNQTDLPENNNNFQATIDRNMIHSYLNRYVNNITNIIREEFDFFFQDYNQEDVPVILRTEEFNKLPSGKYGELKKNHVIIINQCGITLEDFTEDSKIILLPCGHPFMKEEIFKWLTENSNKCPICRKESGIGYPKL